MNERCRSFFVLIHWPRKWSSVVSCVHLLRLCDAAPGADSTCKVWKVCIPLCVLSIPPVVSYPLDRIIWIILVTRVLGCAMFGSCIPLWLLFPCAAAALRSGPREQSRPASRTQIRSKLLITFINYGQCLPWKSSTVSMVVDYSRGRTRERESAQWVQERWGLAGFFVLKSVVFYPLPLLPSHSMCCSLTKEAKIWAYQGFNQVTFELCSSFRWLLSTEQGSTYSSYSVNHTPTDELSACKREIKCGVLFSRCILQFSLKN